MTIDYTNKGKVKIFMYEYINKLLSKLPLDMDGVARTPTVEHLFNVSYSADMFDEDKAQLFDHIVAKLLYLSLRCQQDIQKQ